MRARRVTRAAVALAGLAVIAGAVWWAAELPAYVCAYDGDAGTCRPTDTSALVIVIAGLFVGGGMVLWALWRDRPSHRERSESEPWSS